MKKIAFYLYNRNISDVDFTRLLDGNPGVGGSEYLIVLTAWQLAVRDNGLEVTLFVDREGAFPQGLKTYTVKEANDALEKANEKEIDIFVIDHKRMNWSDNPFSKVKEPMKIVCWCHNFVTPAIAKIMIKSPCVQRVVAVGREQMDLYRDDSLFLKSDYIYNSVPVKDKYIHLAKLTPYKERPHSVAYLGSLVKDKNFHVLASIWQKILDKVPDAQLYVIGSSKVYSKNMQLGRYGIADAEYENLFMPFLTDDKGKIIPSVHFLGAMGEEKFEVLKNIRVGCPNPTGASETFCLSAVEMQAVGCTVAAMQAPGYYDTFFNGKISKNINGLVKDIVELLQGESPKSYEDTLNHIKQNFSIETVMADWEKLLGGNGKGYLHPISPISHFLYKEKIAKEFLRLIYFKIPFLYNILPSIETIKNIIIRHKLRII